jgi:lipopolysaccharide export system permease protein
MKIKNNSILFRFLSKHFLRAFLLVFVSVAGIIALSSIINNAQSFSNKGTNVPFRVIIEFAALSVFYTLNTTLPLSVLLAGILTFWRLARTSELTVIRSVGLSAWSFLFPIVAVCAALGVLNMAVLSPINAALQRRISRLSYRYELSSSNPLLFSQSGLWLKEKNEAAQSFIFAEFIRKEGDRLAAKNLTIFITDLSNNFLQRIEAESAILDNNNLSLSKARTIDPYLSEKEFETYDHPTALTVDKIEENSAEPESFSFWELPGFIRFFESSGFSARKHRAYFYTLLFMPATLVAMLFISAVFSISPRRNQMNLVLKLSAGVLAGFGMFFMDQVAHAMGTSGRMPLLLSIMGIPVIAILICSTILLYHEDG